MTRDPENATVGNAPGMDPEGTRSNPPDQPAVARTSPISLTTLGAERLRTAIDVLFALADELGISHVTVNLHKISQPSAFEVFPAGDEILHRLPYRTFAVWEHKMGRHLVSCFTGDVTIKEAAES